MKTGMLWFDNDPKTDLEVKIKQAATYYQKKYGRKPNLCFVHPSMLKEPPANSQNGVEIKANRSILPHHLWIGLRETPEAILN